MKLGTVKLDCQKICNSIKDCNVGLTHSLYLQPLLMRMHHKQTDDLTEFGIADLVVGVHVSGVLKKKS